MSLTIELKKAHSRTHPENLDKLVDWVSVTVDSYNSLSPYISEISVEKPANYTSLQELWKLATGHKVSLTNSDRKISGDKILMCSTLSFVYDRAYHALDELLSEYSQNVAKGNFKLVDGGNTLLAGYSGKCSSISYDNLQGLDCTCTDKWDGEYLTYREVFDRLRSAVEAHCLVD